APAQATRAHGPQLKRGRVASDRELSFAPRPLFFVFSWTAMMGPVSRFVVPPSGGVRGQPPEGGTTNEATRPISPVKPHPARPRRLDTRTRNGQTRGKDSQARHPARPPHRTLARTFPALRGRALRSLGRSAMPRRLLVIDGGNQGQAFALPES